MKKMILSMLSIVLLLSATKTLAQAVQTTSKPANGNQPTASTTGNQGQTFVRRVADKPATTVVVSPNTAKAVPHKPQMTPAEIQEHETALAQDMGNTYAKNLSLTSDQHARINTACLTYAKATDEQRTGKQITRETIAKCMAELNKSIQGILTTEQYNTFQAAKTATGSPSYKN